MLYRSCRNEKNNVLPLTKGFIYPWHQNSEHYLVCHLLCILYIQLMKCLNMVRGESDGNQKDVLFPFLCEALNGIFCLRTQPWHGTYLQKNNNQDLRKRITIATCFDSNFSCIKCEQYQTHCKDVTVLFKHVILSNFKI